MDLIRGPRFVGTTTHTGEPGERAMHLVRDTSTWTASCGKVVVEAIEWPADQAAGALTCGTCRRSARLSPVAPPRPADEVRAEVMQVVDEHGIVRGLAFADRTADPRAVVVRVVGRVLYQLAVNYGGTWKVLPAAYPHPDSARALTAGALAAALG